LKLRHVAPRLGMLPPRIARQTDAQGHVGSADQRLYDATWRRERARHLRQHPLCLYCEAGAFGPPCVTAARVVDHLYPHRGDRRLFWLRALWVSCCAPCHNGPKQARERQGERALDALARLIGYPTRDAAPEG
jgi:5-methylcytosine-specific restriction protein A